MPWASCLPLRGVGATVCIAIWSSLPSMRMLGLNPVLSWMDDRQASITYGRYFIPSVLTSFYIHGEHALQSTVESSHHAITLGLMACWSCFVNIKKLADLLEQLSKLEPLSVCNSLGTPNLQMNCSTMTVATVAASWLCTAKASIHFAK